MKSQASVLLHVLEGLFTDARLAYPELKESFLKDLERIALNYQKRGLTFFLLDLPNLDSLLLRGLEEGRLKLEGPVSRRVSKRILVPRLLSGLWLRVFDESSCLRQDVDSTALAFIRQIVGLGKRIQVDCSPERVNASIRNFINVDQALRQPTLQWADDTLSGDLRRVDRHFSDCLPTPDWMHNPQGTLQSEPGWECDMQCRKNQPADHRILDKLQQVADLVSQNLMPFLPLMHSAFLESKSEGLGTRHGPGAVAERLKNHEKSRFPNWPHKLEQRFPFESFGKPVGFTRDRPLNHEVPSRLICVPKTAKGPRLIAAEPVAHQWCQQLIYSWIRQRLDETRRSPKNKIGGLGDFINFRRQDISGGMVYQASLNRKLATVDLTDASDRLSCWTVERMFRRNPSFLSALHAARTRWLMQDISSANDSFIKLRKFSSQGAATNTPVQSLCFLIIALASAIGDGKVTWERIMRLRGQVRVYGDDTILPTHGYVRLSTIMDLLQLKVNKAKSFVHGHFRESCGVDGYLGDDVTPVKPKTFVADGPTSCQAVIDTTNNLFYKGYWHASNNLQATIPIRVQRGLRIVARTDVGFAGLASFSGSDESHLRQRWNSRLHRYEGKVWRLSPSSLKRDRQGFDVLTDFFSRAYDPYNPRIAGTYGQIQRVSSDLLWEPLNSGAHGYPPS